MLLLRLSAQWLQQELREVEDRQLPRGPHFEENP